LTVRRSATEADDDTTLELIPPGVTVIRTESPEPVSRLMRVASGPRNDAEPAAADPHTAPPPRRRNPLQRLVARSGRGVVRALTYPDYQIGWAPRVAREVRRFVRAHPGAVVLSSTPPHSTQLGVRAARTLCRFTWIADFRDPWSAPFRQPKGPLNHGFQRSLERWVVQGCDHVIANTDGNRKELLAAFPHLDPARVSVVTNAFDVPTLPAPANADDPAIACDIAYFGEVYPGMLDDYLAALRVLLARDPAAAPRLHVFGRVGEIDARRVREEGLSSHVVFMGTVPYRRSLELMRAAPSLLLLLPAGESMATCIPSKFYPYLFTGRRILAFVPRGDTARVVEETQSGDVVEPGNVDAAASRLASFVADVRRERPGVTARSDARAMAFAMDRIADRVHAILEGAVARG
jgi:glycosyltransferase involved in cell wall biosynthesis